MDSEEKLAKERASVAAMKNAQSNMSAVLDRVSTLESCLRRVQSQLSRTKGYIGSSAYVYTENNRVSCHKEIDEYLAEIAKVLG